LAAEYTGSFKLTGGNDVYTDTNTHANVPDGGNVRGNDEKAFFSHYPFAPRADFYSTWRFGRNFSTGSCLARGSRIRICRNHDVGHGNLHSQDRYATR
jgi:hypothetical protein